LTPIRELRRTADLSQQEFATLIDVPLNTLRMWDSGLRPIPIAVMHRAAEAVEEHARRQQLLSLDQLDKELGVHIRTLQAAARTGRLEVHFSVRSAFGRPIRFASRAAGERFLARHYRRSSGQETCPLLLPIVPNDYDQHVRRVRRRLGLTQCALAQKIGAAGKAVVYQWESRKRTPAPVLWQRLLALQHRRPAR
jgi:DNA-binding transcriptional regulator YiaG